jgi:hypothetical protein
LTTASRSRSSETMLSKLNRLLLPVARSRSIRANRPSVRGRYEVTRPGCRPRRGPRRRAAEGRVPRAGPAQQIAPDGGDYLVPLTPACRLPPAVRDRHRDKPAGGRRGHRLRGRDTGPDPAGPRRAASSRAGCVAHVVVARQAVRCRAADARHAHAPPRAERAVPAAGGVRQAQRRLQPARPNGSSSGTVNVPVPVCGSARTSRRR